uniref:G_PROTEIN_RECEP_F1_2 domain-containing protein n=1 Tax=Loa loa TaxID=7209 RepID=A0A1I7VXZ5_LOALO
MNQQIMLETKKLRQLQVASVTQSETGHLLAFTIIAITIKVIVIIGVIFALQACWIQSDDYDIENLRLMFYNHWVNETTRKEEISGIPMIDFTYCEGRRNKFIGSVAVAFKSPKTKADSKDKTSSNNLIKLPIWFGYIHLSLSLIVAAGTLHATIWWDFTSKPIPSMLIDFCTYDMELCRRQCDVLFNEGYFK